MGVVNEAVVQEWFSTAEAARYLGLTSYRVRAEFASGRLLGSRLGYRTIRFKRKHLDALMGSLIVPEHRVAARPVAGLAGLVPHKRRGIPPSIAS